MRCTGGFETRPSFLLSPRQFVPVVWEKFSDFGENYCKNLLNCGKCGIMGGEVSCGENGLRKPRNILLATHPP